MATHIEPLNDSARICVERTTAAIRDIVDVWPDDVSLDLLVDTLRWLGECLDQRRPVSAPSPAVLYQFVLERADLAQVNAHGLPSHDEEVR